LICCLVAPLLWSHSILPNMHENFTSVWFVMDKKAMHIFLLVIIIGPYLHKSNVLSKLWPNWISFHFQAILRVHRFFVRYTHVTIEGKLLLFYSSWGVFEIFVGYIKNDAGHEKGNQSITIHTQIYMLLYLSNEGAW
jgi:hypothetical protein